MNIVPGASQQICDQAEACAHGDQRTALAMLLGAYVEMASRLVMSEQPSHRWLLAMAAYCQAGTDKLRDASEYYARGHRTVEDDQGNYLGQLAGAQQAGAAFAQHLQDRFEAVGLTLDRGDDVDAQLDA